MSEKELSKLCAKRDRLRKALANHTNENEATRKMEIMELLHQYNDVKDAAQVIIGALANVDTKTIKSLHEKFNTPKD